MERAKLIDPHLAKIEEWVERSHGKIRADVVFERLELLGFCGSDRTCRRAVARGEDATIGPGVGGCIARGSRSRGCGPSGTGVTARKSRAGQTYLWCAWLAWSRFRVIIPTWDKTLPTVIGCLDRAMRTFGGCPTYWLTDNEKTVTVDHVAGIAVRHPLIVAGRSSLRGDDRDVRPGRPRIQGRVGIDGADRQGRSGADRRQPARRLQSAGLSSSTACEAFMDKVNTRAHRITRRPPVEMLVEERQRLHRLPDVAFTAAFGETRQVTWSSTISFGGVPYSVPHELVDAEVWVRVDGDEIVATHVSEQGAVEVARHLLLHTGQPADQRRPLPAPPARRRSTGNPKRMNTAETEFLALGEGARHVAGRSRRRRDRPGEGEDGRRRSARPSARRRAGRLGARACRHVRPVRRRRPRFDPRRPPTRRSAPR